MQSYAVLWYGILWSRFYTIPSSIRVKFPSLCCVFAFWHTVYVDTTCFCVVLWSFIDYKKDPHVLCKFLSAALLFLPFCVKVSLSGILFPVSFVCSALCISASFLPFFIFRCLQCMYFIPSDVSFSPTHYVIKCSLLYGEMFFATSLGLPHNGSVRIGIKTMPIHNTGGGLGMRRV